MESLLFNNEGQDEPADTHRDSSVRPPLAARLRPRSFDDYLGQEHILGKGKLLRRAIDADSFSSIVLAGPPGSGKTTLAELIALQTNSAFLRLSGVVSKVSDIRREISAAETRAAGNGRRTILFIDEIHRFNRAQQDVLLPVIENGTVRFVGATTQNPFFYINGPLLSRSLVFKLEPLSTENIIAVLRHAISDERGFESEKIQIEDDAAEFLAESCEGDARRALNALEIAVSTSDIRRDGAVVINLETAEASIQQKALDYGDDGHYDTASAFIKSMRGSDPDASVYWLAKMLHAGEDIRFIARRIVIFASEDVGNADPRALSVALDAMQAVEMIGMPEARIILSQAVTYCATAPKSNAAIKAIDEATQDIRSMRIAPVPKHLRDSHYSGAEKMGHGKGYIYPHSEKDNFAAQDYLGIDKKYYRPDGIGYEAKIAERIKYWDKLRGDGAKSK